MSKAALNVRAKAEEALARHHRVPAADNRGAGSSEKPDEPYSHEMLAGDTLAAMDAAAGGVADIVGFSMGARIAIELCSPTQSGCGP